MAHPLCWNLFVQSDLKVPFSLADVQATTVSKACNGTYTHTHNPGADYLGAT